MKETERFDHASGQKKVKPECIIDYNRKKGSVDKTDMLMSFTDSMRKSVKWYKKFFFHLLDMAVLNAHVLYQKRSGQIISFRKFKQNLTKQLVEEYHTPRTSLPGRQPSVDYPARLTERHFPHLVPQTGAQGSRTQRKCHVCRHTARKPSQRKDTRYMCLECDVALCIDPCFKDYHTLKRY